MGSAKAELEPNDISSVSICFRARTQVSPKILLVVSAYLGYDFSSFCMALFKFFWFFSWFELGSIVLVAVPVHTSCFVVGSYISSTRDPTLIVDWVADPIPPPKPRPVPHAFHCFSLSTAIW